MTEQLASLLTQKQALDEQIAQTYAQAKQAAIEQAKSLIQAHNMTQAELGIKASPLKGRKAPVKYTGPNGETWSGRGRTPKWYTAAHGPQ